MEQKPQQSNHSHNITQQISPSQPTGPSSPLPPDDEPGYVTQSTAGAGVDLNFDLVMDDDLAQNTWPEKLTQYKKRDKVSLMAQTMTSEIFEKYKDKKTKLAGWTIARAINTGTCYPNSSVGCHAGDLESFHLFSDLFTPVVEHYHLGYKCDGSMNHISDMDSSKLEVQFTGEAISKIISTRIRVARNLFFFPLNPGGTKETGEEIASLMKKVCDTLEGELAGQFYLHTTMTPEQIKQMVKDNLLFKGEDKLQAASGYHLYWPHGRGIFLSHSKEFILWVNEGDHLRIISMEKGGDVKRVFERLSRGVLAIEKGIKRQSGHSTVFMNDPILGMISCCPANLGTGLRASVHIRLPKLTAKLGFDELGKIAKSMNCQVRGSSGEHSDVVDRVDVSNRRRLGFKEWALVQDMIRCVNKLVEMEDSV